MTALGRIAAVPLALLLSAGLAHAATLESYAPRPIEGDLALIREAGEAIEQCLASNEAPSGCVGRWAAHCTRPQEQCFFTEGAAWTEIGLEHFNILAESLDDIALLEASQSAWKSYSRKQCDFVSQAVPDRLIARLEFASCIMTTAAERAIALWGLVQNRQ